MPPFRKLSVVAQKAWSKEFSSAECQRIAVAYSGAGAVEETNHKRKILPKKLLHGCRRCGNSAKKNDLDALFYVSRKDLATLSSDNASTSWTCTQSRGLAATCKQQHHLWLPLQCCFWDVERLYLSELLSCCNSSSLGSWKFHPCENETCHPWGAFYFCFVCVEASNFFEVVASLSLRATCRSLTGDQLFHNNYTSVAASETCCAPRISPCWAAAVDIEISSYTWKSMLWLRKFKLFIQMC